MRKLFLTIIGAIVVLIGFNPMMTYAFDEPEDCELTKYRDEFHCKKEKIHSYCSTAASLNRALDMSGDFLPSDFSLYEKAYCNSVIDSDEEIFETIVTQFAAEDPSWDEDLIRHVLFGMNTTSIEQYLENAYGDKNATDELPVIVNYAFFESNDFTRQNQIYRRVKTAYDREKIIYQSKESLKEQFKHKEIWTNGTLSDSPFDLIVDLNLIEIIMFGSGAQWVDDVYSFASDDGGGGSSGDSGIEDGGDAVETEHATSPNEGEDDVEVEEKPEEYECIPDEEFENLFGKGRAKDALAEGETEPGKIPEGCGNRILDTGEECDDGNNEAGDGCSEACRLESGNSLSCRDPDAVTFKQLSSDDGEGDEPSFGDSDSAGRGDNGGEIPITCPEGSTAVRSDDLNRARGIPQSPNYPGPFIGGVLKNFPPSTKPACRQGESEFSVTIGDEVKIRCIPTKLCADPEDFRKFLMDSYGLPQKDVDPIEAVICVEFFTHMRPESPYPLNEGCIDCHILAMNDLMEDMLEKNIAPLVNNMADWGLSNRWGPKFTFDLTTSVQAKLKIPVGRYKDKSPGEATEEYVKQTIQDNRKTLDTLKEKNKVGATPIMDKPAIEILQKRLDRDSKAEAGIYRALKNYQLVTGAEVDQQFHAEVPSLLNQILESFVRIQGKYVGLSLATEFHQKDKCSL